MTLFLDLDGPILDTTARHYEVYRTILREFDRRTSLSLEAFWRLKRAGNSTTDLLALEGHSSIDLDLFYRRWLQAIESPQWLKLDIVQPRVLLTLQHLIQRFSIVLITLRQDREALVKQLLQLGLSEFFRAVLSDSPLSCKGWETKARLIERGGFLVEDVIIGDTEIDIRAGKLLGIATIGVSCGIREYSLLAKEKPDLIVDTLANLHMTTIEGIAKKHCSI